MPAAKREKLKSTKNARNARRLPTKCACLSFLWHLWHFLAKRQGTHRTRSRKTGQTCTIFNTKKNKKTFLSDYQPPQFGEESDLRKVDILKNKSSFGVKIC
jgi:hypothetical protein